MSQSPPNYMDGVPVKISERFKPPPKITLPQSVINRLAQVENGVALRAVIGYAFELEETVLKRITEWRAVKEKERDERDERVRLKEQERARLVDEEQKRKLNQISYPNTDDLSSASEGEDEPSEENDESSPSGSSEEQVLKNQTPLVVSSGTVQYSHMNKFDTILMPTVLPEVAAAMIGATGKVIDSGTPLNFSIPKNTNLLNNNNNNIYNKINYSDFENDTSSPFDNMELKTINDLDILAQVYNLNISNSGSVRSPEDSNEKNAKPLEKRQDLNVKHQSNETSPEQSTNVTTTQQPPDYQQQSQYPQAVYLPNPQQQVPTSDYYKSYNSYQYNYGQYAASSTASYASADNRFLSQYNSAAGTSYQPSVQSQYQPFSQGLGSSTYNYYPYTSSSNNSTTQSTYANAYFYSNAYGHQSQLMPGYNYSAQGSTTVAETPSTGYGSVVATDGSMSDSVEVSSMRSKSKSVPDIVRQLDEEVKDSAQRRTRNNSQSVAEKNHQEEDKSIAKSATAQDLTLYNRLSPSDQNLVKRIESMGFPLERVAAVLKRIGHDDKKIVEHLIPLSELLDLGFEEEKISDALVKFDNNKHKALDYLIS
ncbi:uncharacterized protein DDB_G0283357-like [Ochlerotatus camptorhynchus]|uniref:uncharacterized protein DDB_G0283357 n=1 Tax=Ochlerotatus camptorhynchus TaxID=644619 RepID=UPI0031DF8351